MITRRSSAPDASVDPSGLKARRVSRSRCPARTARALAGGQVEQTDDHSLVGIGRRRERHAVRTDGERGIGASDLADLLVPRRCRRLRCRRRRPRGPACESARNATSRRKFSAENSYRTTGAPPCATSQTNAHRARTTRSREFVVRHGGDVSAVRAERRGVTAIDVLRRQRSTDDGQRRRVDECERANFAPRRPSTTSPPGGRRD